MVNKEKKKVGRPQYEANERDAGKIEALASIGVSQRFIAFYLGKDKKTIAKYYPDELHQEGMSYEERKITMENALFYQGAFLNIPVSTMFWLKKNFPEKYADIPLADPGDKEDTMKEIANLLPD